jgi:hypothetical protein
MQPHLGWQAVADLRQASYDLRRGSAAHATTPGVAGAAEPPSRLHSRIASPVRTRALLTRLRKRVPNKTHTHTHTRTHARTHAHHSHTPTRTQARANHAHTRTRTQARTHMCMRTRAHSVYFRSPSAQVLSKERFSASPAHAQCFPGASLERGRSIACRRERGSCPRRFAVGRRAYCPGIGKRLNLKT